MVTFSHHTWEPYCKTVRIIKLNEIKKTHLYFAYLMLSVMFQFQINITVYKIICSFDHKTFTFELNK